MTRDATLKYGTTEGGPFLFISFAKKLLYCFILCTKDQIVNPGANWHSRCQESCSPTPAANILVSI